MKPKVIGFTLLGGHWSRRARMMFPGGNEIKLDNGQVLYVGDSEMVYHGKKGVNGCLDLIEDKADTAEFRKRLDVWEKTGVFPPVGKG